MKRGPGAPKHPIQEHFTGGTNQTGKPTKICNYCGESMSETIAVQFRHLESCPQKPTPLDLSPTSPLRPRTDSANKKQKLIEKEAVIFPDFSKPEILQKARIMLAKAIYSGAAPFTFVENPDFEAFCSFISGQTFKNPSRQLVGGDLLKEVVLETMKEVWLEIQRAQAVTFATDGTTDGCQELVSHVLAILPNHKVFLIQVICHGSEKLTGEKICGDMLQLSESLRRQLNVRVKGLITDNENKMVKCRKLFKVRLIQKSSMPQRETSYLEVSGFDTLHRFLSNQN